MIVDGNLCYFLINDYTNDGGHLNAIGEKIVGEKLLNKIFEIIISKNEKLNHKVYSNNTLKLSN